MKCEEFDDMYLENMYLYFELYETWLCPSRLLILMAAVVIAHH